MPTFNPTTIRRHQPVRIHAHGTVTTVGIREVYRNKGGDVVGFNAGGSSFDLDGQCKVTPWIRASEED